MNRAPLATLGGQIQRTTNNQEKQMIYHQIKRDKNGNRVCRVTKAGRGFSIQTNGNLERTHRDGIGAWTAGEVSEYVANYGTKRQKELLGL